MKFCYLLMARPFLFPGFILINLCLFQIPEYCRVLEESEISEHCFDLIFAFDEIVALGYRENVNLAQIRTFTEMDSHEEKVFRAVREVRLLATNYTVIYRIPRCDVRKV